MADLMGKLGQQIKGSVGNFGSGLKQAAISGNPALFGAMAQGIEKGFQNLGNEMKKDREERRRDKQFEEEKANEEKKVFTGIQKALMGIEDALKKMFGGAGGAGGKGGAGGAGGLLGMLRGFGIALEPILAGIIAGLIALNDSLADFFKIFAGWTKNLFKTFKLDDLVGRLVKGLGTWIDDVLKAARGKIAALAFVFLEKFGKFFDDVVDGIRNLFKGSFLNTFITKLKNFFDVELDFIKNFKMPGWTQVKEAFNAGMTKIVAFFDEIAKLPGIKSIAAGLGKFVKAIPIIGNLIMVIEGIFEAFDTESLAQSLQKAQKDINFGDRIVGFFGGLLGSIFGILDLVVLGIKELFGIDMTFADGETIQKKATRLITGFIGDFFGYFDGLFKMVGGLLTGDNELIKSGLEKMNLIVEDWLIGFTNFFGSMLKVPFAKMTNAVAGAMELMVNGIVEAMNGFVGFILDVVGNIPGAKKYTDKAKEALKIEKIKMGRMDETPYKKDTSRRAAAYEKTKAQEKNEAAAKKQVAPAPTGSSIVTGSANLDRLTDEQKATAKKIYDSFIAAGFTDAQAQGAVANAFAESRFDPKAQNVTAKEASYGLFQMNTKGGLGTGYSSSYLMDANNNIALAIQAANKSRGFLNAQTAEEAARAFSLEVERPAGGQAEAQRRAEMARAVSQAVGINPRAKVSGYGAQRASVTPVAVETEIKKSEEKADRVSQAIYDIRDDAREQHKYVKVVDERDKRFREERAGLEGEFYNTMRNMYRDMIDKAIPGMRRYQTDEKGNIIGGGRALATSVLGKPLDKLGKELFGDQFGGQMGSIFTRLAGSYVEQFAGSLIGGMFGVSPNAVQKGMYQLAQGNKQGFFEELIFGKTGIPMNMEQAVGGVGGMEQIARDLAEVTGMPFAGLFSLGGPDNTVAPGKGSDPFVVSAATGGEVFYNYAVAAGVALKDGSAAGGEALAKAMSEGRLSGTQLKDAYGNPISGTGGIFGAPTAAGRLGQAAVRVGGTYITNKLARAVGAENNPFARALIGGVTQGGLSAVFSGGDFMQSVGGQFGFQLPPGLSMLQGAKAMYDMFSGGLANMSNAITFAIGDMGTWLVNNTSGFLNEIGGSILQNQATIGALADTFTGYMAGSSINTMISGGKSMGGTMDTVQNVAIAAASFMFGPIGGAIAGAISGILNAAFGRGPTEVRDYGLTGTLGSTASAQTYVQKHQEGGWFSSDRNWTEYSAADPKTVTALSQAVQSIQKSVRQSSRAFRFQDVTDQPRPYQSSDFGGGLFGSVAAGMNNLFGGSFKSTNLKYKEAYEKLMTQNFTKAFTISLKGKSAEEQKEILEKLLKDYTDDFIRAAFGNMVDRFKKEGERLSETFDRLAGATLNFNDVANKLGYQFQNLTGIVDLLELAQFKDTFIELSGGTEKFVKDATFLFDKFYTDEEKLIYLQAEGQRKMQEALIDSQLEGLYSVSGLTTMAGDNFEEARKAYRKLRDDFIEQNKQLLASNDPDAVKKLAYINGELAQSYYVAAEAAGELAEIQGKSAEALKTKWASLFGITPTSNLAATTSLNNVQSGTGGVSPNALFSAEAAGGSSNIVSQNLNNGNTIDNSTNTTVINQSVSATDGSSNRVVSGTNALAMA